jgi:TonB family protein
MTGASALPLPFQRRPDRSARRLVASLWASIGLHGGLVLTVWILFAIGWLRGPPHPVKRNVDLHELSSADWERNRRVGSIPSRPVESSTSKMREAEKPKHEPEALPKGQVVDVAAGNDKKPTADTKYLAEHNNTVEKETRARNQTAFYGKAMPRQTTNQPVPKPAQDHPLKGNQGTGNDDGLKKEKTQVARNEIPDAKEQKKVAMLEEAKDGEMRTAPETKASAGNSFRLMLRPPSLIADEANPGSDGRAGSPDVSKDEPSEAKLDKEVGGAPNDDLHDVDVGDGTFLNTREFKYAGFFNRVKQAVGENWNPTGAMRRQDPQGRRAGAVSRVTLVTVVLNQEGELKDIRIAKSCGVDYLDEEAVAAFQRAQPFLYPPPGLLDSDGLIRFQFGFHLDNGYGGPFSPAFRVR